MRRCGDLSDRIRIPVTADETEAIEVLQGIQESVDRHGDLFRSEFFLNVDIRRNARLQLVEDRVIGAVSLCRSIRMDNTFLRCCFFRV